MRSAVSETTVWRIIAVLSIIEAGAYVGTEAARYFWDLTAYVAALDTDHPWRFADPYPFLYPPFARDLFTLARSHLFELLSIAYVAAAALFYDLYAAAIGLSVCCALAGRASGMAWALVLALAINLIPWLIANFTRAPLSYPWWAQDLLITHLFGIACLLVTLSRVGFHTVQQPRRADLQVRDSTSFRPGTSRKSSGLSVQIAAPLAIAKVAMARSISRPRDRDTCLYSFAARTPSAGPNAMALSEGNSASCASRSAFVRGPRSHS